MQPQLSAEALKAIERHLDEQHEAILAFIKSLVEIESPSSDPTGSRAVVDLLSAKASALSCVSSVERIDVPGVGQHFIVRAFPEQAAQGTILLVGHTDTVHPHGSTTQRPWRIEGDSVYGPGIFDMKGTCALALQCLETLDHFKIVPRRGITLVLTCDEEVGSFSGWPLLGRITESENVTCALVLEPPGAQGSVKTGRKGTGIFEMLAEGRAAHAGLDPEKGANAIVEMARQITRLQSLNGQGKGISVNVGVIRGGTRSNVVPAEAQAEIDVRFSTMEESEEVAHAFSSIRPFDERVRVTIRGGINRPPMERNEKVLELYGLARAIGQSLGFELGEVQVGGASDGNFIAAKGIAVLDGLGIPGDGAHADHEHIIASAISRRGALLSGMLASI